jgi:hypothetical protein
VPELAGEVSKATGYIFVYVKRPANKSAVRFLLPEEVVYTRIIELSEVHFRSFEGGIGSYENLEFEYFTRLSCDCKL